MYNLNEIVSAVRNGEKVDYDDLRYAICALDALSTFDQNAFTKLAQGELDNKPRILVWSAVFQHTEHFNRWRNALDKNPKVYIGWNNDPDNPEFLERRRSALKLIDKLIKNA